MRKLLTFVMLVAIVFGVMPQRSYAVELDTSSLPMGGYYV